MEPMGLQFARHHRALGTSGCQAAGRAAGAGIVCQEVVCVEGIRVLGPGSHLS